MVHVEHGGVFWLVEKQPVNQVPSTELTIIYSKAVMSCGCHSSPKQSIDRSINQSIYLYLPHIDKCMPNQSYYLVAGDLCKLG